jgi:hypothetical protein
MVYLYDACNQISDFCHQQLLRKMWRKISWTDGQTDRGKDSYFLFVDFDDFYTHWTYMLIFRCIFLNNYWWQKSDIWSQASYRYPISWPTFLRGGAIRQFFPNPRMKSVKAIYNINFYGQKCKCLVNRCISKTITSCFIMCLENYLCMG